MLYLGDFLGGEEGKRVVRGLFLSSCFQWG